jgi:hypothetical protein
MGIRFLKRRAGDMRSDVTFGPGVALQSKIHFEKAYAFATETQGRRASSNARITL